MTGIGSNLDNFLPNASIDPKSLPEWTWRSAPSPMYRLSAQLHLVAEISTFQNNVSELANTAKTGTGKNVRICGTEKVNSPSNSKSFPGSRWSLHLWVFLNWPHKYEVFADSEIFGIRFLTFPQNSNLWMRRVSVLAVFGIFAVFGTFLGDEREFGTVLGCKMTARTRRCRLTQK